MNVEHVSRDEFSRTLSKESTTPTMENRIFALDKRFYLLYYSLLFFIFSNAIGYYKVNGDSAEVLIVGVITSVSILLASLILILIQYNQELPGDTSKAMYAMLYFSTGIIIVISDPQVVSLFSDNSDYPENSCLLLLAFLSAIGSKYLLKQRRLFYILSYIYMVIGFGLSLPKSPSILHAVLEFMIALVFIYYLGGEIVEHTAVYQVLATEEISDFKLLNPNTPFEEILLEIHKGIEKIMDISKNTPPNIQRLYKRIVRLFKNVMKKMQNVDNIYVPRLDLITRNMDEEDRIFIEQEFFEGHSIQIRCTDIPAVEREVIEYGVTELSGFLKQIGKEWNFNTFFVAGCSKYPAMIIGKYAILMYGLNVLYSMSETVIDNFLLELEKTYNNNLYHNSLHGADVMCSLLYFLTNSCLSSYMNSLEWLSVIIASISHDVGHPGKNNRFLVMTSDNIALTYNDISVLEMMHASILFKIASKPESNLFNSLSTENYVLVRKSIIDMILATDMAKHFDLISYIRTKYNENSDFGSRETRADLFKICIKAADVGHAGKCIELHERWCMLIIEEFFIQGDLEKEKGIPISMYCDRSKTNIAKSQAGFIKNIVLSLFLTMNTILVSTEIENICIIQLRANEIHWDTLNKQRNLSSACKSQDKHGDRNIIPLLRKKTLRKGSLPAIGSTSTNL